MPRYDEVDNSKISKIALMLIGNPGGGGGGEGGTTDHRQLTHRSSANAHPISSITGLQAALDNIPDVEDVVEKPIDTTVTKDSENLITSGAVYTAVASGLDHRSLTHRSDADQHPMSAITGLVNALLSKYTMPDGGIPRSDLDAYVQHSLDRADSALQSHQSLSAYRIASAQDVIDNSKQPKNIVDAGGYFTTDTVEGALAEIGAELAGINTLIGSGVVE